MKPDTHMDYLIQRIDAMNDLLNLGHNEVEETEDQQKKKKSGGKKGGGFFGTVPNEMFFRRSGAERPRIVGITHPSDGHPQEELTPDFGWFRALSYNNPTWTLYWPELII